MRVADYIANFLVEHHIETVFSVTGGGAMHLNDAFGHCDGLEVIYNHHEQACAMAAEGYVRTSGKTACVCVTSGPGGTNALTGVMGAWLDSIPMLVISGQMKYCTTIESTDLPLRQLGFQEFNIIDAVGCMTKYAVFVKDSNEIAYHLEKAIHIAENGRPGPVWIDIPLDIQGADINVEQLSHFDASKDGIVPPVVKPNVIEEIFSRIKVAKRPLILAGNGIYRGHAEDKFLALINKLNIPVVNAWNAHGLIYDDHPLFAGHPGTIGTRGGNFVVQNCDLLISLGCRMHIRLISYAWENFAKDAFKIAVDIDENELKKPTIRIDLPICADVNDVITQMLCYEYKYDGRFDSWISWCRDINDRFPVVLSEYYKKESPVNPYVFMKYLSDCLTGNDVIVASNGAACVCGFQTIKMHKGEKMFSNAGASSMGYGLPAAIGASVSLHNKKRVICLEGDGSIQMNLQELQTVIHHKLNIKIFWINNDGYHSIRQSQYSAFKGEIRGYCGVNKESGISFPSAEKIAYAYGFKFVRIDSLGKMKDSLNDVFNNDYPTICEVVVDKAQFFEPKLSSKVQADGTIVSPSLEDMYPFIDRKEFQTIMAISKQV